MGRTTRQKRLYFITGGGKTKVGTTVDVEHRLANMQTGSPAKLTLAFSCDAPDHGLERRVGIVLHWRRSDGEWYEGEVSEDEARSIVEEAEGTDPGVGARTRFPGERPECECHGEQMYWSKNPLRRGGGTYRCAVKGRQNTARTREESR